MRQRYRAHPVRELGRLYKLVQQLIDYHAAVRDLPERERQLSHQQTQLAAQRAAHQAKPTGQEAGQGHPRRAEPRSPRRTPSVRNCARRSQHGGE